MAKTKPNAKASLSGDKVITRICATRALKNAKVIRKAAPHIIPPREPLEGFRSLVPVDILKRFHRMSEADLRDYPELVEVKRNLPRRPAKRLHPFLFGDPPFKGTLHFVQMTFSIEADGSTVTVANADVATAIEYATLSATPISAYASQYGSNHLEVSPDILQFGVSIKNNRYNDDTLQSWVNSILDQNHLPSGSSCIIILNPLGMTNTDGDRADGIGGYHDQANVPYCFVNLFGTGLTVSDTQDFYADTLSHEIAEMTCDPDASIFNDEVCDGCAGNCNNSWRNFFVDPSPSLAKAYIKSSKDFPPAFPFTFFIASIAMRSHAEDCPAPDNACAYGINGGNFTVDPGTAVTALSRSQDHIDLFVTGTDGGIYSTYWDAASSWASGWFRISDGVAKQGSAVTAMARTPDHLDLFVTGTDGGIYSIYWDANSGWPNSWFRL